MQNINNEKGATMIEYALLLSLIAMAAIPSIVTLSDSMSEVFLAAGGSEGTDILTGESDPGTGANTTTDPVIILRIETAN